MGPVWVWDTSGAWVYARIAETDTRGWFHGDYVVFDGSLERGSAE
ncbi:hypothetical protein [Embleya scabrispora]|nr:hypothetical protein [Embleya scabrispora]